MFAYGINKKMSTKTEERCAHSLESSNMSNLVEYRPEESKINIVLAGQAIHKNNMA